MGESQSRLQISNQSLNAYSSLTDLLPNKLRQVIETRGGEGGNDEWDWYGGHRSKVAQTWIWFNLF